MIEEKNTDLLNNLIDKQIEMSKISGDLGVLSYLQALQNMNLLTQNLMKKEMNNVSNNLTKEDIKEIVKTIVTEILHELGAEINTK